MRAKFVNEAIKHLLPKSKDEMKAIDDKIKSGFIDRKADMAILIEDIEKDFKVRHTSSEYPVFSPLHPERKAIDFSMDVQFNNNFSFYIRTQEFSEGFEIGYSAYKVQGQPVYNDWMEVEDIDEAENWIRKWIKENGPKDTKR